MVISECIPFRQHQVQQLSYLVNKYNNPGGMGGGVWRGMGGGGRREGGREGGGGKEIVICGEIRHCDLWCHNGQYLPLK